MNNLNWKQTLKDYKKEMLSHTIVNMEKMNWVAVQTVLQVVFPRFHDWLDRKGVEYEYITKVIISIKNNRWGGLYGHDITNLYEWVELVHSKCEDEYIGWSFPWDHTLQGQAFWRNADYDWKNYYKNGK